LTKKTNKKPDMQFRATLKSISSTSFLTRKSKIRSWIIL